MGEVEHDVVRLVEVGLEGEDDVVDEQVAVGLADLEPARDVVEHGHSGAGGAGLVEDVERLDALELVLFVHVVLGHDLLELGAGHVHGGPAGVGREEELRVHGAAVLRRAQVGQEGGHLVEGAAADGLGVAGGGEEVADLLLVVPEQPVEGQHVGVGDEAHGVALALVEGLAVGRDGHEEPWEK